MRKISDLSKLDGRVYVYLTNDNGEKFIKNAEREGFTFTDGAKPSERGYAEIMAINHDNTINYVGVNGRIAFQNKAEKIGEETLIRVDYGKFDDGDEDYMFND